MATEFLDRISKIAAELLPGEQVSVGAKGEDYYIVDVLEADGRKSNFPPIWLLPSLSDQEIKAKLSREFGEHLHPESMPDDLSVPNLRTEGTQR